MTTQVNGIDVAELKQAVSGKALELKAQFLASKVKKDQRTKEFYQLASGLFEDFDGNAEEFCNKFDLDYSKLKKRAERKAAKAVEQLLAEE